MSDEELKEINTWTKVIKIDTKPIENRIDNLEDYQENAVNTIEDDEELKALRKLLAAVEEYSETLDKWNIY